MLRCKFYCGIGMHYLICHLLQPLSAKRVYCSKRMLCGWL